MSKCKIHDEENCLRCPVEPIPTINLYLIVDVSPSMISRWTQTLSGLNEYVSSLRTDQETNDQPYKVTMVTFSSEVEKPYDDVVLDSIPTLTDKNFSPHGNGTSLYDAVGSIVKEINTSDPVLVVVMTDGEDNSSHKWDESSLDKLLEEKKMLGNYTFAYLGVAKEGWGGAAKVRAFSTSNKKMTAAQYNTGVAFCSTDGGLAGQTIKYSAMMRSNAARGLTKSMNVSNLYDADSWSGDSNDLPVQPSDLQK